MSEELTQPRPSRRSRLPGSLAAVSFALGCLSIVVGWGALGLNDVYPRVVASLPRAFPWFPLLAGLVGFVLGMGAAVLSGRSGQRTLAGAGIWISVVGGLLNLGFFTPASLREFAGSRKLVCMMNTKNLVTAMQLYLGDNNNVFPPAAHWCDQMMPLIRDRRELQCPNARGLECAYAYNAALGGVGYDALADSSQTVAVFESDKGWNAAGGPESVAKMPRHFGGDDLGFADGHAGWVTRQALLADESRFRWKPNQGLREHTPPPE